MHTNQTQSRNDLSFQFNESTRQGHSSFKLFKLLYIIFPMSLKANKMYMANGLYTEKREREKKMKIYSNDMIKVCYDKKNKVKRKHISTLANMPTSLSNQMPI